MRFLMRLRLPALVVGALALALVGCGGGGGGTPDADDAEEDFVVIQEIPTNRQEVTWFLEETNWLIEIEFSVNLDRETILDASNPFNGLSANLNMLDSNLYRVPGTPSVTGRTFRFLPPWSGLVPQQYTITVTKNVHSVGGQSLPREFYTSFTVGPDVYAPIIRRTYPVQNQSDVARDTSIVFVFNESLDPGSVNPQTVVVQDGGQNPPTPIAGEVFLRNNGFEIEFVPDPLIGLPPSTTVVVTLQGGNGGIADETAGIPFPGDVTNNNQYVLQFDTTAGGDPLNQFAIASVYFSDQDSVGVLDIGPIVGFPALTLDGLPGVGPNSRRVVGNPEEIVLDWRINGNGDTFLYVVDRGTSTIAVINTLNSRVVGRIPANNPRGVAFDTTTSSQLLVTEFGTDSVATYNISNSQPGTNNWDSTQDPWTGSALLLARTQVGRGPTGVSHAWDQSVSFVVNNLEATCSIIQDIDQKVWTTWQTGANPQDVSTSVTFNIGYFAVVSNGGTSQGDPGSVSFWWNANPGVQQWLITGLQNPRGMVYDPNTALDWYVANSGTNTVSMIQIQIAGNTIVPALVANWHVGSGPQNVTLDPVRFQFCFSADRAAGIITQFNAYNVNDPSVYYEVPGVKWIATLLNQ